MHTAQAFVYLQPLLLDLVELLAAIVLAMLMPQVPYIAAAITRMLHLKNNDAARAALAAALYDGIHFAEAAADDAVTHVGGIDVGDPRLAAVANYAIVHAPAERRALGLTDEKLVAMAQVAIKQFTPSADPAPGATTETKP